MEYRFSKRGGSVAGAGPAEPRRSLWILAFNSSYREFAAEPLGASAENLAAARRFVKNLEADGGTEMLPALLHLMRKPEIPGYVRHIVLLTDGDLGNEEESLQRCDAIWAELAYIR